MSDAIIINGGNTTVIVSPGSVVEIPVHAKVSEVVSVAGSYVVNVEIAPLFEITMTSNIAITFSNLPSNRTVTITLILKQDAVGSRIPSFLSAVNWAGGVTPTWETAANNEDVVRMFTYDAGVNWRATLLGKNYG